MKRTPREGEVVEVQRYDTGAARWHTATVTSVLSAQFGYRTAIDGAAVDDLMLYNSTDWRYPNAHSK